MHTSFCLLRSVPTMLRNSHVWKALGICWKTEQVVQRCKVICLHTCVQGDLPKGARFAFPLPLIAHMETWSTIGHTNRSKRVYSNKALLFVHVHLELLVCIQRLVWLTRPFGVQPDNSTARFRVIGSSVVSRIQRVYLGTAVSCMNRKKLPVLLTRVSAQKQCTVSSRGSLTVKAREVLPTGKSMQHHDHSK